MEKRFLSIRWGLVLVVCLLTACDLIASNLTVFRGNYYYEQGAFQRATVEYLKALEHNQYRDYITYNLGNVYHSLGETVAALEMWRKAQQNNNTDILFGVAFNKGIQLYEQGRYEEAYNQFRNALTIDPRSIAAKINIELSLRKIEASETVEARSHIPENEESLPDEGSLRILEYIRIKEQQRWRATQPQAVENVARDW